MGLLCYGGAALELSLYCWRLPALVLLATVFLLVCPKCQLILKHLLPRVTQHLDIYGDLVPEDLALQQRSEDTQEGFF